MEKRAKPKAASVEREAFVRRLISLRESYGREIGQPGITKGAFAKLLGLEEETYRSYETGRTEPPLWVLGSIRRLTGVSLNSLVAGEIDKAA